MKVKLMLQANRCGSDNLKWWYCGQESRWEFVFQQTNKNVCFPVWQYKKKKQLMNKNRWWWFACPGISSDSCSYSGDKNAHFRCNQSEDVGESSSRKLQISEKPQKRRDHHYPLCCVRLWISKLFEETIRERQSIFGSGYTLQTRVRFEKWID